MKKLFALLVVITFFGSYVSAQNNTATTNQIGDNGTATVTQTGLTNSSLVNQTESAITTPVGFQNATVIQTGTSNYSEIYQTETGDGGHTVNNAFIQQIGTTNNSIQFTYAPGYNSGQNVWGYQNGLSNQLTQTITAGYTNSFVANQNGDLNIAQQNMASSTTDGKIDQLGNGNYAKQYFTGQNHGYYTNGMLIVQTGADNDATQEFHGGGWGVGSNGQIHQTGNLNNATQYSDGFPNTQLTTQVGDENQAETTQNGNFNSGIIYQDGNFNFGSISSTGNNNIADINQVGNTNSATIIQTN
jgi:hypothetical protein